MNDEMRSGGPSAFDGYALGRLSPQRQQVLGDAAAAFGLRLFRSGTSDADVNALLAENEVLRQQLGATQAELAVLRTKYNELDAWATRTSDLLIRKGLIKE